MESPEYNIGIIGCGKMGTNIFHFLTDFPFRIVLIGNSAEVVEKTRKNFKRKMDRSFKHGLIHQDQYDFRISNTVFSCSLSEIQDCNLVIESISEDLELKKALFKNIDKIVSRKCILASNTSSIPLPELIPSSNRNLNTIGLHFFYPVSLTNLIEVNTLYTTSTETLTFINSFLKKINKFYIIFSGSSNFSINKMFLQLQAGCCFLHQEYKQSFASIDTVVKETLFPLGMFELFDHVGIDTMLISVKNYLKNIDDNQFYQPLVDELEILYKQGKLGRKSGEGFYQYQDTLTSYPINIQDFQYEISIDEIKQLLYQWYLNPIDQLVASMTCTKAEIDHIVKEYMNASQSPFELAKQTGFTFSD